MFRILGLLLACIASVSAEVANPLSPTWLSERKTIAPGETFRVGFLLDHPEGYHSYWKHPGVVGYPTKIEWELPEGFVAGEILWPAPEAVKMAEYRAQGYHGRVILVAPITVPERLDGGSVTLRAKLSWMCCGTSCHPAIDIPFSFELKTGKTPVTDKQVGRWLDEAEAKVAKPDPTWAATAAVDAEKVILTVKPTEYAVRPGEDLGEVVFFTSDGLVDTNEPQRLSLGPDGSLVLTMKRFEFGPETPERVHGILYSPEGWDEKGERKYIEIAAPIAPEEIAGDQ